MHNNPVDDNDTGADCQANGDHRIPGSSLVKIVCQSPGGGAGVVRLEGGPAPGAIAVTVGEEFPVTIYDGGHDGVAYKATQERAIDLGKEHDAGGYFHCRQVSFVLHGCARGGAVAIVRTILAHLQVIRQADGVVDDIVGPGGEIHVANGAFWEDQTGQHLGQVVRGNAVSKSGVQQGALQQSQPLSPYPGREDLTKGEMKMPNSRAIMYAHAGKVMFCVVTTIRPRTKLKASRARYHQFGVSL